MRNRTYAMSIWQRIFCASLALLALGAAAPTPSADSIAFDQLQLVRDCGFAPKDCDAFFGPSGFDKAYRRSLKVIPGDQRQDSLPGNVYRLAYYGTFRRAEDVHAQIAIIADTSKNSVTVLDLRHKWYVHVNHSITEDMNKEWIEGRTITNHVNPEFWVPAKPVSSETTKIPDEAISGMDSHGRLISMRFKWTATGLVHGPAEAQLSETLYQAYGMNEPCPTFHMGSLSLAGPVMGFCRSGKTSGFVTYFYRNVTDESGVANMYPTRLIVERGHFRQLDPDDIATFQIPQGFRNVCTVKTDGWSVMLQSYC